MTAQEQSLTVEEIRLQHLRNTHGPSWLTSVNLGKLQAMRPSYIKVGDSYRPCIRDDAGRVVWQADVVCANRDHSTSRGPSARDLAKFALEAATEPEEFRAAMQRPAPECVLRSEWERESWRSRQQQYRWALAIAEQVKTAIES